MYKSNLKVKQLAKSQIFSFDKGHQMVNAAHLCSRLNKYNELNSLPDSLHKYHTAKTS